MATKPFTAHLDPEVIANFEKVAEHAHTRATFFAAQLIGRFSELKPEHALDALGSIPKEYFRRGPGRPPATRDAAQRDGAALTQNPA